MTKQGREFGVCLFGYNKQEVNDDICKFKKLNKERLDDIKQKVEAARIEKERLIQEIEKLKQELNSESQSEEFIVYALKKFEDWMPVISQIASDEAIEINVETEEKKEVFNKKISELGSIIKDTQENLDILLGNALRKSESFSAEVMNFLEEKSIQNEKGQIEHLDFLEVAAELQDNYNVISQGDFCVDGIEEQIGYAEKINHDIKFHSFSEVLLENNDISNDLSQVKNKYLVGKIAGEDLYDDDENKIIGKNQIISEEVVRKAIKKGKLAELIISMVNS